MLNPTNLQAGIEHQVSSSTNPADDSVTVFQKDCQEESDQSQSEAGKIRGCYRKYTYQEKQRAVNKIQQGFDVKEVSKVFGIPRRNLLRWKKDGCERKEGGGRPTDLDMQAILYDKIKKRQINGEKQIRAAAIQASKSQNFKASKGWFSKFCRRYKIKTGEDLRA